MKQIYVEIEIEVERGRNKEKKDRNKKVTMKNKQENTQSCRLASSAGGCSTEMKDSIRRQPEKEAIK